VNCGVVSDRTYAFGFKSSPTASRCFSIFHGTINLEEREWDYLLQEKSLISILDRTTNCEWWKWFLNWISLIQTKFYQSLYSLAIKEFINCNGIDYLEIHNICSKPLPLIEHKFHQYFDGSVWELCVWQGGNLSNLEPAKELISGQSFLNLN